ncbi:hypothetical protein [Cupriavidus sp. AU9028]|uniref:hypothetical protein n=1 Tax=Cupriavidus sp. AU9028 TaxID=2871157 RepID=UPI001C95F16D|nr:hypothetical protein [Cupriavidus sp. AU9028]MBY4897453.1 hypothetical protein [Cupriavidus sp. AU9028]
MPMTDTPATLPPGASNDAASSPPPSLERLPGKLAGAGAASRIALVVEHETGGVAGDYDEGISGLWQFLRYLGKAIRQSPAEVGRALVEEAQNLRSNPAGTLRDELLPVGRIEWGLAAVSTPLMLALGAMAITGGVGEIRGAVQKLGELQTRRQAAREARDAVRQLRTMADGAGRAVPRPVLALEQVVEQKLDGVRFARRIERLNIGVGVGSLVSGAAIVAKVVLDTAYQLALAAAAGGLNLAAAIARSATLASVGGIVGAVGAFVLAPLAGIAATALGAVFVHQSRLALRRFTAAAGAARTMLQHLPDDAPAEVGRYRSFLVRKLGKRGTVLHRFRNWNAVFLAGSLVCGLGAVAKGAVAGAALLGVGLGVLSGPIGLGVLLLFLTVGGVTMALGSHTFFFTLGKTRRYQDYHRDGHGWIDRDALALADRLDADKALQLRASLFAQIDGLQQETDDFLLDAARRSGTRYAARRHEPTDAAATVPARPRRWARALCRVGAALLVPSDFCLALARGRGLAAAWRLAELAHDRRCGVLTEAILSDVLENGADAGEWQAAWMRSVLARQIALLDRKAGTRRDNAARLGEAGELPHEQIPAAIAPDAPEQEDWERQEAMRELMLALKGKVTDLAALRSRFLALQWGSDPAAKTGSSRDLARFCLHEAPTLLATLRGSLLAAELEIARLRVPARQAGADQRAAD